MKFSFKDWLKKKPVDPLSYYLKQSRLAIYISVMFLVFFIGHNWVISPNKIVTTDNWLLFPFLTIELFNQVISQGFDKVIFGVYSFVFDSIKYSFSLFGKIAFWGVVVFMFVSLIFGFVAGFLEKNKKVLVLFSLLTLAFIVTALFVSVYSYFVVVVGVTLLTTILLKKKNNIETA